MVRRSHRKKRELLLLTLFTDIVCRLEHIRLNWLNLIRIKVRKFSPLLSSGNHVSPVELMLNVCAELKDEGECSLNPSDK